MAITGDAMEHGEENTASVAIYRDTTDDRHRPPVSTRPYICLTSTSGGAIRSYADAPTPEIVDTETDDRIFALLDDGCNRCCHSSYWMERASKKLHKLNRKIKVLNHRERSFEGIGEGRCTTIGSRLIPIAIELSGGDVALDGEMESTELREGKSGLLLSLQAQALMGLVKDMETGSIWLKHQERYARPYVDAKVWTSMHLHQRFQRAPFAAAH